MSANRKSNRIQGDPQNKLARKRETVLGTNQNKGPYKVLTVIGLLLLVIAVGYSMLHRQVTNSPVYTSVPVKESKARIAYPVDLFKDGKARHFRYETEEGIVVKYFILKSSDDVIRAAFDACDVCWPAGKGYHQDGDVMVCRNCGRQFASARVNEVKGGCNPAPLKRRVENGQLVIETADLLTGRRYFSFNSRS